MWIFHPYLGEQLSGYFSHLIKVEFLSIYIILGYVKFHQHNIH